MPPARRARRLVLVAVGGAAALAIGLSPAGAKVGDLAENMAEAVGIGADDAKPALRSLPAAGELLVESEQGPWIVREDGSKRLLGDYDEASWSPRGLFVAAAKGRELIAVDPAGEVRWTIDAPGPVSDPRWGGIGFDTRIAYRSGDDLWVVDGDGSDERLLARDVAPVAPAWRPTRGHEDRRRRPPRARLSSSATVTRGRSTPTPGCRSERRPAPGCCRRRAASDRADLTRRSPARAGPHRSRRDRARADRPEHDPGDPRVLFSARAGSPARPGRRMAAGCWSAGAGRPVAVHRSRPAAAG